MRRRLGATLLAVTLVATPVAAQQATEPEATEPEATEPEATEPEATEPEASEPEATEPEATEPEVYATWWFWASIVAVVLGVTTAIIVDVTTDDPAPSDPMDPGMRPMGLQIRF